MHPFLKDLLKEPIAHRGLHDGNLEVIENSRSAFAAAIERGYGIELDVQLSSDNRAIVFHDETLDRLTDGEGLVRNLDHRQLAAFALKNSADHPETLEDILSFVAGRVPVVVEMKDNGKYNPLLAKAVADAVEIYSGPVAVMSFSQDLLKLFRQHNTETPLGLTAEGIGKPALIKHEHAFEIGIDFVSYSVNALHNAFLDAVKARGLAFITWTVRNAEQAQSTWDYGGQITFEGFDPRKIAAV